MDKTSGYTGTPLARKLGIKEGFIVQVYNTPQNYLDFFDDFPKEVSFIKAGILHKVDFVHLFVSTWAVLERDYPMAKANLKENGILWISWPKKSSGIPSQLGKMDIRQYGLDHGLVDVKVASINESWSAHKFVYRLKDRRK